MEAKKRVIKKYEQIDPTVLKLVHEAYPYGFEENLISFQSPKGELELALPFETEEVSYLIKMPKDNIPIPDDNEVTPAEDNLSNFESLEAAENIADED